MAAIQVNYARPIFWAPANAIGKAASVHGERDGQPIIINLYWSGMMLTMRQESSDEQQLAREVTAFLESYVPTSDELILHFQSTGEAFQKIVDPHWVPGEPV